MLQMGKKLRHTPQALPFQLLPAVKEFPIDIHVFIKMPCEKPMLCHIAVSILRERAPEISAADQEIELLCELLRTAVDQPRLSVAHRRRVDRRRGKHRRTVSCRLDELEVGFGAVELRIIKRQESDI